MYENRAEMQSLRTFCVTEQWRSCSSHWCDSICSRRVRVWVRLFFDPRLLGQAFTANLYHYYGQNITVLLCPGYGTPQTSAFCKVWLHLVSAAHDGFNLLYFSKPCVCQSLHWRLPQESSTQVGLRLPSIRQKKKIKCDTWNPGVQLCVGPHAGFGAVSVLWQQNSTNRRTARKAASVWHLGNLAYFAVWKLIVLTIIRKKNPSHGSSKAKWGKGRWHLELQTFPQLLSLCFWSQAAVQTLWWFVIKPKAWRFCGVLVAYQVKVNLVSIMEYFSSVTPWGSLGTDRPFILNRWPRLKKTLFVC